MFHGVVAPPCKLLALTVVAVCLGGAAHPSSSSLALRSGSSRVLGQPSLTLGGAVNLFSTGQQHFGPTSNTILLSTIHG